MNILCFDIEIIQDGENKNSIVNILNKMNMFIFH